MCLYVSIPTHVWRPAEGSDLGLELQVVVSFGAGLDLDQSSAGAASTLNG